MTNLGGIINYSLIGWLSVCILGILIAPNILISLNKRFIKTKNKNYFKIIKFLRKLHKPLGLALLFMGLIHGYMALGTLKLHTGTLFYLSIIITAALGGSFYKTKNKLFFKWHKRMAFFTVVLFFLHYIAPSAIYYLIN